MKLDELIERCNEGVANRLGHHKRLALFADTAAALRMLRDVAVAARDAQQTGRDLFLGTAGMHNVAEASKRIDTALAALRDAGMIDAAYPPKPASGTEENAR